MRLLGPSRLGSVWDVSRGSDLGLLLLSLGVGAGAGLGAVAFRWLITSVTLLLSGHRDYSLAAGAPNPHVPWLGRWFVLFAPVVAGLVYGPLVHLFAREARGHGVPEVMYAVARRGGRIPPQVAAVKALASALCIGGGGSVGREGPIVQIGAALGSTLGRVVRAPEERLRVLVACGSAGGIAATFNAPLAGVFFAMELILADFAARSFGMVVLASVTASIIGRAVLGTNPFLSLPAFRVEHGADYLLFAGLGVLAGVVGVGFTRVLYAVEDVCDAVWRGPEWLRPAVGGLILGALLLVLPEMYGVGYPVLAKAVAGGYGLAFLLALLVGKVFATSLTIGIGGSGGVFAPSLFVGAMAGAAYGRILETVAPATAGPPGAYALIGMGAVFAGSARAPITAVVILFELTGEYTIILPLMAAIVLATGVSQLLSSDTVYTAKLRRRGVDLQEPPEPAIRRLRTTEALLPVGEVLPEDADLQAVARALSRASLGVVGVTDATGAFRGVVTARAVADHLANDGSGTTAGALVELPAPVTTDDTLDRALDVLDGSGVPALPVLDEADHLVGWITHQALLRVVGALPARPAPPVRAVARDGRHGRAGRRPGGGAPTEPRA